PPSWPYLAGGCAQGRQAASPALVVTPDRKSTSFVPVSADSNGIPDLSFSRIVGVPGATESRRRYLASAKPAFQLPPPASPGQSAAAAALRIATPVRAR